MKYVESGEGYSHRVDYVYDDINNLTSLVEVINNVGLVTDYSYDDDNRVSTLTSTLVGGPVAPIQSTTKEFTYDGFSRVTKRVTKDDDGEVLTEQYTYRDFPEGSDNPTSTSGQVKQLEIITNDNENSFNTSFEYSYDANGNIASVTSGGKTTSYTYDTAGQLLRENNQAAGKTWVWTYDNAGNILTRKEYTYSDGTLGDVLDTVTYGYGNANWGDLLTSYNGKEITYDAIGNPVNDGNWAYTWEHGRQLASMTNGTTTIDYEYNADGLRTKKTVTTSSNHTHVYDETEIAATCTTNGYTLHTCVCGHIYQDSPVTATGHTYTASVIADTCTTNGYTLYTCACGDSYQEGSSGHTFTTLVVEPTETVNGFTLHECECGYSYQSDPVASLGSSGESNGPNTSDVKVYDYIYNGSSLTQLTITTTEYGESPVVETLYFGAGTVTYNSDVFYYVTNLQGDVIAILDSSGTAVVEYSYDAWGNILEIGGSDKDTLGVANPLTYRGYVFDHETSLYYLQSRYYNSEVGRFINADTLVTTGQGFLGNNMFAYCNNNPVLYMDPDGREILAISLGATFSLMQALVTVAVVVVAVVGFCALAVAAYKLGEMTADAVSDLWVRVAYSRGKGQSKRISKSQASKYAAPQPPFNNDDDDDDYYDNDDHFGGKQKIGKSKGNTPQNNQAQNEQFEAAVSKLGLSPQQSEILHRLISGQGYGYQEIIEFAINFFNLKPINSKVMLYE